MDTDLELAKAIGRCGCPWPLGHLCVACQILVATKSAEIVPHQTSSKALKDSASQGCHLCSLLQASLPLSPVEDHQPSNNSTSQHGAWAAQVEYNDSQGSSEMKIVYFSSEKRNESWELVLEGSQVPASEVRDSITAQENAMTDFADCTSSKSTFATARAWLDQCISKHGEACGVRREDNKQKAPTRLIEIHEDVKFLSLVNTPAPDVRYLILSYCWGKETDGELKLLKTNEAVLQQRINFQDLPQTVADAVVATCHLGYRYLWVDRLCIVQDDDDDWYHEAKQMGGYYANADCCLAAQWADHSRKGLFSPRNPLMLQPLRHENPDSGVVTILDAARIGNWAGQFPRLYRGPAYPLTKRAWVLQETLLPPRTLHFGSLMVYWECRKVRRAEHHPYKDLGLPYDANLRKLGTRAETSTKTGSIDTITEGSAGEQDLWYSPRTEADVEAYQDRWADLVEYYTSCALRYPTKDRMAAFAGIIDSVLSEARQELVHGLLVSRLTTELLWWQWVDCNGDLEKTPERTGPRVNAPTWSWGSVTGRIQPIWSRRYFGVERRLAWKIEVEASLDESNALRPPHVEGSGTICKLNFSAPMLEATVGERQGTRYYSWSSQVVGDMGNENYFIMHATLWPDEGFEKGTVIWLLRCAVLVEDDTVMFEGLVLAPLEDGWRDGETPRWWRRVGYWQTNGLQRIPAASVSPQQMEAARRTCLNGGCNAVFLL